MTRLFFWGPSVSSAALVVAVLCALGLPQRLAWLPGVGVAQAGKRWHKKPIKRGKSAKPARVVRGAARKGGIAALPPLRGGTGEPTSVMLATAQPASGSAPATAVTSSGSVGKSPVVSAPPPAPLAKGTTASAALKKKKGPPSDDEMMEDAQAAYVRGDRGKAIELALVVAEKSNERSPAAWKFIGLAACSVRSHRLATRAYQGVRTPFDQRAIADACKYNGLSYKGDQFVGE